MRLSVAIITKNEAHNLAACLASLDFVDEIVVLDSSSTDNTRQIAAQYGAIVEVSTQWEGFGKEKNKAIDLCTGDWILSLDADERVPASLRDEIHDLLSDEPGCHAYSIPRLSWFCGKFIYHSGWRPDHVTRLFRRGMARFSDDLVHERLIANGQLGVLKNSIVHISFRDFDAVIHKINVYSAASAKQMSLNGRRGGVVKGLLHGLWTFIRTYLLRLGFLDGQHGLALAISNAQGTYYRYAKLWFENHRSEFAAPAITEDKQHS
jgi:glycosyltransferase involved in cell wall biosynthesis